MADWVASDADGDGTVIIPAAELALRRKLGSTLLAFVDYHAMDVAGGNDLDTNGRLQSFNDECGNAFEPVISNTVATQLIAWVNEHFGLSLASSRGVFRSTSNVFPTSGSFTLFALFSQTLGSDGWPFANGDSSTPVSAGFKTTTNGIRVNWGTDGEYTVTGGTNVGDPVFLVLSYDASVNKARVFFNNAKIDERTKSFPNITDRRLYVGGWRNAASVTAVVEGTICCVGLLSEAGDGGSALMDILYQFAEDRAAEGWPTP